jgi:hypothetical protein
MCEQYLEMLIELDLPSLFYVDILQHHREMILRKQLLEQKKRLIGNILEMEKKLYKN